MKIYQVGGSVRDMLRGEKPLDYDYVVVGADIAQMLKLGYIQVGKNFPVFLHPISKEEYALARKEIKVGNKHTDFKFIFNKDITLEEDLLRRDFCCNAIAYDVSNKQIIDPLGGQKDIKNKLLRHINATNFQEDPLRILRMCRFCAQLDFCVAPQTMELAKKMTKQNLLQYLSAERIWKEVEKALAYPSFYKFVETAKESNALAKIMPDVDKILSTPKSSSTNNSGPQTITILKQAKNIAPRIKLALLLLNLKTIEQINELCNNLKIPKHYANFARLAYKHHKKLERLNKMSLPQIISLVKEIGKNSIDDYISLCIYKKNKEEAQTLEQNGQYIKKIYNIISQIKATNMPDFATIAKDDKFKNKYNDFVIKTVRKKLKEK